MVVGDRRPSLTAGRPGFLAPGPFQVGGSVSLGEAAARHLRVLRLDAGALVALRDGGGAVAAGQVVRLAKTHVQVDVEAVFVMPPLPAVHLLVPVADRERMLWVAEKGTELGITSWRPVVWRRSRSVSPRGEGLAFHAKVRARMEGALLQSEGAWLPQLFPEATVERAIQAAPAGRRLVLDATGQPVGAPWGWDRSTPVVLAVGPEGGMEADELALLEGAGFHRVRLGPGILRFETAAVAAAAMARMALDHEGGSDG